MRTYHCPILSLTLFDRMSPKSLKLRAGVGAIALVMSKFVHPSKSICDKYPNWPKNHKLRRFVLVEVDMKVVRKGSNVILVFVFTHLYFPNQQLYAAKQYIHVTKEGEEDSLFFLEEAFIPADIAGAIGPLAVDENNRADGAKGN